MLKFIRKIRWRTNVKKIMDHMENILSELEQNDSEKNGALQFMYNFENNPLIESFRKDPLKEDLERDIMVYLWIRACLIPGKPWTKPYKIIQFLEKYATAGRNDFAFLLGFLLYDGTYNIEKDPVIAHYWMKTAADNGFPEAIQYLKIKENT